MAVTFPVLEIELAELEVTDDLLDEARLLGAELLIGAELEELLAELLVAELLTTELVVPQAATKPKGTGWLAQVERAMQLLLFS